jgi:hypothetical protein
MTFTGGFATSATMKVLGRGDDRVAVPIEKYGSFLASAFGKV